MKTYGTADLKDGAWHIRTEPQVAMRFKRLCQGVNKRAVGVLSMSHTPDHCRDLAWFLERYPMQVTPRDALDAGARRHMEHVQRLSDLVSGHEAPPSIALAMPPRDYQAQAAAVARAAGGLLLADDVGLGKTMEGIATIADQAYLPALIVAPPHLLAQWQREFAKFAPHLRTWVTPGTVPKPMPMILGNGPDVIITSYTRLHGWAQVLAEYVRSVVYDEVHELRHSDSKKATAAAFLAQAERIVVRLGMSATPIFNYGGEFFNVVSVLAPGRLGTNEEFLREWCTEGGDKAIIKDPEAFGAYLRDEGLMLRRTRQDVARELPPVTTTVQTVDCDAAALEAVGEQVRALAQILLGDGGDKVERFRAGGELDWRLRQATGLAKAPAVADVVRMLVESGEPVLLLGWHRAVYDVWADRLQSAGVRLAFYTGEETPAAKAAAVAAWQAGEIDVLILSLRSGAGIDGLQDRGSVVVFGELDWSPSVHEQCIGRLWRDGQHKAVVAYYLVSDDGADPIMAEVNGLKRQQLDGVRRKDGDVITHVQGDGAHIRRLAEQYLLRHGAKAVPRA